MELVTLMYDLSCTVTKSISGPVRAPVAGFRKNVTLLWERLLERLLEQCKRAVRDHFLIMTENVRHCQTCHCCAFLQSCNRAIEEKTCDKVLFALYLNIKTIAFL